MMRRKHTIAILAYNNHELTTRNLDHLTKLGYREQVLLFDNGSQDSFRAIASELGIRYQREEKNLYVNPAWNKIIAQENCHYLTLLNNDCFALSPGYFDEAIGHMEEHQIGISSCRNKNIVDLKKGALETENYFLLNRESQPLACNYAAPRQGWLMTLDLDQYKTLDYKIPGYLRLWYGDDWIWGQFSLRRIKSVVYQNRYSVHIKSSSVSSSEMQKVIAADVDNLEKFGDWYREIAPAIHKKSRLLGRYAHWRNRRRFSSRLK